jgi:hypothetical protein
MVILFQVLFCSASNIKAALSPPQELDEKDLNSIWSLNSSVRFPFDTALLFENPNFVGNGKRARFCTRRDVRASFNATELNPNLCNDVYLVSGFL